MNLVNDPSRKEAENTMKTALITGASRGIGRATALRLAATGKYPLLCLTAHTQGDLLEALAEEIRTKYPEQAVFCRTGDIGSHAFTEQLADELHSAGGTVQLLINNAAVSYHGLLSEMSPEDWDRVIRTNLTALYNTCHTFIPDLMSTKEGRIINLSSVWGAVGASCEVAYSASKGGVDAFTRALAKELAPSGIAVNALQPGVIDTDMNLNLSQEDRDALADEIPAGRFATPEEAADAILRLAEMPSYLTGSILRLDGGWY